MTTASYGTAWKKEARSRATFLKRWGEVGCGTCMLIRSGLALSQPCWCLALSLPAALLVCGSAKKDKAFSGSRHGRPGAVPLLAGRGVSTPLSLLSVPFPPSILPSLGSPATPMATPVRRYVTGAELLCDGGYATNMMVDHIMGEPE